jgi:hypothetical protein
MDIVTIVVALALIFIAYKVLSGIVKFGLIALVIVAALWFLTQGGF